MLGYMILRHILPLLIFLGAACAANPIEMNSSLRLTAESLYEDPLPLPDFIMNVTSDARITFTQAQCVMINQEPFWEKDYGAEELFDHLMVNFQFTVDGQTVPESQIEHMLSNSVSAVRDSTGNVIGSYGGPITICMNTAGLKAGLHVAAIRIMGIADEMRSYEWAFQHIEVPQTEELPTLPALPSD